MRKSYRHDSKRQYWLVVVRWKNIDLDGNNHGQEQTTYRFPSNYSGEDALNAAADRWDNSFDWLPSEYDRAVRTYHAAAKLVRTCDLGAPL